MNGQFRQRAEELAREIIRKGDYNNLINPGRGARIDRDNQDDRSLRYSFRDISTFGGKGDSMFHTHMIKFGDFLVNIGSEINDFPKEPQTGDRDDREYHKAVIKDVVSKFKASLKGKPGLWFEMQYFTPDDEPKTKEAYEKMVSSFITEHNPIGSTREQQIMAWKNLNWHPAQERIDDFVFRRIAKELGYDAVSHPFCTYTLEVPPLLRR